MQRDLVSVRYGEDEEADAGELGYRNEPKR